jgi:hypothetical protein
METMIIPTAIQRLRAFLIEACGMKVKPWATTEETLTALHATLVARHECKIFWASLRGLLESLAHDLKARQGALPGTVVDNELLDSSRYEALLDEIRAVLARGAAEAPTFRRLASALSAPALGLLLLLGGTTTVACDRSTLRQTTTNRDAGSLPTADSKVAPPEASPDIAPATTPDLAPLRVSLDAPSNVPPDVPSDVLPDVPSDARSAFDASAGDGAIVTIQDILQTCNISGTAILSCLATLRASWSKGMADALAGLDCKTVSYDLACFAQNTCTGGPPPSGDFDAAAFTCPPVIIYLGVRFV